MKRLFFPALTLLASTLCASLVHAAPAPGSKRPGPSAVEAARLKKYPAPSYLAHYLPDDRYKIAGGVWKYVSTDLDTYYHVPNSPNMLRQPADRVIGFANARDAEEAGLVADPTDGTAARAKPQTVYGGGSEVGRTGDYPSRIAAILRQYRQEQVAWAAKLGRTGQTGRGATLSPAFKASFAEIIPILKRGAASVAAIKPPSKYARFHSLLLSSNRNSVASMQRFIRSLNQGGIDLGSLDLLQIMQGQQELLKEAERVGINLREIG